MNGSTRPSASVIRDALTRPHQPSPGAESRTLGRIAADADALDAAKVARQAAIAASPCGCSECAEDRAGPTVFVGNEVLNTLSPALTAIERAKRAAVAPPPIKPGVKPIWATVAEGVPNHAQLDKDIELRLEYSYDAGERGDRWQPGVAAHVSAAAAYLPKDLGTIVLRSVLHEMGSTAFKFTPQGMITEESLHDFIRDAGPKIIDVLRWCEDEASEQAAGEDPEEFRSRGGAQ